MSSNALDASVTLEEVLAVVQAKRVPVAAELAGYLVLEIAEGADPSGGDVDTKAVYVGEEGTVALVKRRDGAAVGDAETSVRVLLGRLLEASGSHTPALVAAARRRAGAGLPQLVLELEAALIPVNRAAGRRALARLAREVRRVTLGVGRNAGGSVAPPPDTRRPRSDPGREGPREAAREPSRDAIRDRAPDAPRAPVRGHDGPRSLDPPTVPLGAPPGAPTPMLSALADMAAPLEPPSEATLVTKPRSQPRVPAEPSPAGAASVPEESLIAVAPRPVPISEDFDRADDRDVEVGEARLPAVEIVRGSAAGAGDEVDSLLASFEVSENRADRDMARDLKALVGLEPTPPPPGARASDETDIEALLASSEQSAPTRVAPPKSPPTVDEARGTAASLPPLAPPAPYAGFEPDVATVELSPSIDFARTAAPVEPPLTNVEIVRPAPTTNLVRSTSLGIGPDLARGAAQPGASGPEAPAPPPAAPAAPTPSPPPAPVAPSAGAPAPRAAPVAASAPAARRPVPEERQLATEPSQTRRDPTARPPARKKKTGGDAWLVVAAVLAVGAGGVALFFLKPGILSGRTPERVAAERATVEADRAKMETAQRAAACRATLVLTDVPAHAEVLLRVGQAPVDVERMPVGTRLEFVAMVDGFTPKRAVVPAGATWDKGEGGRPRYELAIQLDPTKRNASAELWPAADPGSEVGGKGPPGTVHVVASPRGAEVWLLAGVGPEARIEQLPCGQNVDVLLAGPTTFRRRLRIGATDFAPATDPVQRSAQVSAKTPR